MTCLRHFAATFLSALFLVLLPGWVQASSSTPSFGAQFSPSTITPGESSTLIFTISEVTGSPVSDLAFTATLPSDVEIAGGIQSNLCGGSLSATVGGSSITYNSGRLGPSLSCTVSIPVTSSISTTHTLTSGDLTSSLGNSGNTIANLFVTAPAANFSKSLSQSTLVRGGTTQLIYDMIVPVTVGTPTGFYDTTPSFSETLPAGLTFSNPIQATTNCGGTLSTNSDTGVFEFSGPIFGVSGTCRVTLGLQAVNSGSYILSNDLALKNFFPGSSTETASAALTVLAAPTTGLDLLKSFDVSQANAGDTVTLTFDLANQDSINTATNIALTDDLDAMLTGLVATGLPANDVCGTGSTLSGTSLLTLSGGRLDARSNCSFSVQLTVPGAATPGAYTNVTSAVTATLDGTSYTGPTASASLTVRDPDLSAPSLVKSYVTNPVAPGGSTSLEYTLTNSSATLAVSDIGFTEIFSAPSGMTIVPAAGGVACGGTMLLTDVDPYTLTFSGGSLAAGASCTIPVTFTLADNTAPGGYSSTTSPVTATIAGTGVGSASASATLQVEGGADLNLTMAFTEDQIAPNGTATLTYTMTSAPESENTATGLTFSNDINAFLNGATIGISSNTCGGSAGLYAGNTNLIYTNGTLDPGDSCTVVATVFAPASLAAGEITNTSSALTGTAGGQATTAAAASDTLRLFSVQPLVLTKSFSPSTALPGESVTLTYTLTNTDPSEDYTSITPLSEAYSSALTGLAATALPAEPCGVGSTATGTAQGDFNSLTIPANDSCSFDVTLLVPSSAASGDYISATSNTFFSAGGVAQTVSSVSSTLSVEQTQVTLAKSYASSPTASGDTVVVNYVLTSLNSSSAIDSIAFTDSLDSQLSGLIATGPDLSVCNGTLQLTGGGSTINFTGGTLAAGASCTISVPQQVPSGITGSGNYPGTTGDVSGLIGGLTISGEGARAELIVSDFDLPSFTKSFTDSNVGAGGNATLSYQITNNDSSTTLTNLRFTDDLDAALTGFAVTAGTGSDVCGSGSSVTGSGLVTVTGGTLAPGQSCTINLTVTVPTTAATGTYPSASSTLSEHSNFAASAASASLTVEPAPRFAKAFASNPIAQGGTSNLVFTIDNSASSLAASSLDFTDTLPAGMVVAPTPNAGTTCTGGTLTAVAGTGSISYTGGTAPAAATCTVTATVRATSSGTLSNTTGDLTSSLGNSGTASDTLSVTAAPAPSFTKAFSSDPIIQGGVSTVVLTIDNSAALLDVTSLNFTDTLPTGMVVAPTPNASTTCTGGTLTAVAGASSLSYGGGTVAASASCTVSVDLRATSTGALTNTTGDLTSSLGNSGTASDTLNVTAAPVPGFSKTFATDSVSLNNSVTLTFTLSNTSALIEASSLDFTDTLPTGLVVATVPNTSSTCSGGTLTAAAGAGSISYTGGTVAAGASCVVSVNVTATDPGILFNSSGDLTSSLGNSGGASDTLKVPSMAFANPLAVDNIISGTEAGSVIISGTTALIEDGQTMSVIVQGQTTGSVAGNTTVSGNAWSLTLNLSSLPDGALILRATVDDQAATATAQQSVTNQLTKDATAPAGYSASFDQDPINSSNETAASFTFAGAEVGASYGYTISSDGGGTDVTGSGTIAGATDQITGLDLSALGDGTLTLSVILTDILGNAGTAATDTTSKDSTAPGITFDSPLAGDDLVSASEAGSVTISGGTADLPDGRTISVVVTDSAAATVSGTALTSGNAWSLALDLSGLADGALSLTADASDAAGNAAPQATASLTKDAAAPAGYSASFDQDPINSSNETAASFTFAGAEVGASYSYTISSDGGGTDVTGSGTIVGATDQITGLDLSALGSGTLTLSVILTDPAGNAGTAATDTTSKDSIAPGITFDSPLAGDDLVSASEAGSVTISGGTADLPDGRTISVVVTDSAAATVSGTALTSGNAWSLALDLSGLADGALSLTADASDAAGNAAPQATASLTKDAAAPAGYSASFDQDPINSSNETAASFTFAGAEVGASYSYTISSDGGGTDVTGSGTIASATDQITGLDLSALGDGTLTLSVILTDPAGNAGAVATDTASKDSTTPGITFDSPLAGDDLVSASEAGSVTISGSTTDLPDGRTISVVVTDSAAATVSGTALTSGNAWSLALDLSGLADGALSLTADASDTAGNAAPQATASLTKDAAAPAGYSASFDQDPINSSNETAASFTFAGAEVGASYGYTISSDGGGTDVTGSGTIASATDQITGLDLSALGDGTLTLSVILTDPAGNAGAVATDTASKDSTTPGITFDSPLAGDDLVSASEAGSVTISGSTRDLPDGQTISVVVTDSAAATVSGTTLTSGNTWSLALDLSGLADGALSLTADASDTAGNAAPQATASLTKDAAAPSVILSGTTTAQSDPFTVDLTFSEIVTGLSADDFVVDNGAASDLTGSGTSYSVTVTPDHDGTVIVSLPVDSALDSSNNGNTVSNALELLADLTGTPDPNPPADADGDGVPDELESSSADRDGDGIPDSADYDPQGYFYCEDDGRILSGGGITVTGPAGSNSSVGISNNINIVNDGSSGEYQWFAQVPGTYTVTYNYPSLGVASTARLSSGTLDVTSLLPASPAVLGSTQVGSTGLLADTSLSANPVFYDRFVIEAGDPHVLANNIPVTQCAGGAASVTASDNGSEANGATTDSVSFTVSLTRSSTQDAVISYTLGGSSTSGSDYTAPSGSVTILAGSTSATVDLPVLEDGLIEGSETITLTLTSVTSGAGVTLSSTATDLTGSASITDDDFAVISVTNDDLTASESGNDNAAMSFTLLGQPTQDVVLTFAGDAQCNVSPATLTFGSSNYSSRQTLTISAIDDEDVEGNHSCQPTVAVVSGDAAFDRFALALASVTVTDDLVDQIRNPLTEILKNDLEETVKTQQRYFSAIAKGALSRLQAGQDGLGCGAIASFDINGAINVTDGQGQSDGTFGYDVYNCHSGSRRILDGTFSLTRTENIGTQALLQFSQQRERFLSESDLRGQFWGGYLSRTNVTGLAEGNITGLGINGGIYGAREISEGLFLDYYTSGAFGHHRYDLDFAATPSVIQAEGGYEYGAAFAGVALSGQYQMERLLLTPRLGVDLAYAMASDADVTATQLAQTDTGSIDIPNYDGARLFAEIEFASLTSGDADDPGSVTARMALTPRLICESSSYDSDLGCGLGLAFSRDVFNPLSGLTYSFEIEYENVDETERLLVNFHRERRFANDRGAVVTRLSMPSEDSLKVEHGVRLDF